MTVWCCRVNQKMLSIWVFEKVAIVGSLRGLLNEYFQSTIAVHCERVSEDKTEPKCSFYTQIHAESIKANRRRGAQVTVFAESFVTAKTAVDYNCLSSIRISMSTTSAFRVWQVSRKARHAMTKSRLVTDILNCTSWNWRNKTPLWESFRQGQQNKRLVLGVCQSGHRYRKLGDQLCKNTYCAHRKMKKRRA